MALVSEAMRAHMANVSILEAAVGVVRSIAVHPGVCPGPGRLTVSLCLSNGTNQIARWSVPVLILRVCVYGAADVASSGGIEAVVDCLVSVFSRHPMVEALIEACAGAFKSLSTDRT